MAPRPLSTEISAMSPVPDVCPSFSHTLTEPAHSREEIALVYFLRQWSGKSIYDRMFEHVFIKSLADSV